MHERITEPDFFQTQMERLRTNRTWANSFSDIGRLQKLKDRFRSVAPKLIAGAITEVIAEFKYAPTDSEIFEIVEKLSPKRQAPKNDDCQRCGWDGIYFEGDQAFRCSCERGAIPTQADLDKARFWLLKGKEEFPLKRDILNSVKSVPTEPGERSRK